MKKILLMTVLALTALIAGAQINIGVRDTRYINIGYTYRSTWSVRLEHSVYAEKLNCQYIRLYAGYEKTLGIVTIQAEPYFGMTYNNSYSNEGIAVGAAVRPLKWLRAECAVVPHHDSGIGYKTCYNAAAEGWFNRHIALTATFTNRPEYREPEQVVRFGFKFESGPLWAHPQMIIPTEGRPKTVRTAVSLGYTF